MISGHNRLLNDVAAKLTRTFAAEGHRSAVLKGPANAMLYPNKLARQCGDIDIWVDGGFDRVMDLLVRLKLWDVPEHVDNSAKSKHDEARQELVHHAVHHIHLLKDIDGVTVEVHFKTSSGNLNPFTNKRLQQWLEGEIGSATMTEFGFYAPSIRFALVMQLSHIQRHFISGGIGIKQLVDYYVLLKNSSEEDRKEVTRLLRSFGLRNCAGAVMWVLKNILHLDENLMLCKCDERRGRMILEGALNNGYFGKYAKKKYKSMFMDWVVCRMRAFKSWRFDLAETLWGELKYYKGFLKLMPLRLKYRTLYLRKFNP